eukprot:PhF_6_TR14739/c0_g2_i1/m.23159
MDTLLHPIYTRLCDGIRRLPRDCINHMLTYCDLSTTFNAYLVCRSWYHAVDRYLCLADAFYNLPETHRIRRRRWATSRALSSTLQDDARFQRIEVLYLKITDHSSTTWSGCLTSHPTLREVIIELCSSVTASGLRTIEAIPTLTELRFNSTQIECNVLHFVGCTALRKLDISRCEFTDVRGLESIPTLEEITLADVNIGRIPLFSGCRALRKFCILSCKNFTAASIRGLETILTLEAVTL